MITFAPFFFHFNWFDSFDYRILLAFVRVYVSFEWKFYDEKNRNGQINRNKWYAINLTARFEYENAKSPQLYTSNIRIHFYFIIHADYW